MPVNQISEILDSVVYPVIDEVNEMGLPSAPLEKTPDTVLFGADACLDSMGLVSLVVAVEDRIEDTTEHRITLADEKAMSRKNSPFRSVGALAEYIDELLAEASDA